MHQSNKVHIVIKLKLMKTKDGKPELSANIQLSTVAKVN